MVFEQLERRELNSNTSKDYKKYGWKNVAVKIRENDLVILNRQLGRLGYETLGDLVKDLLMGKITRLTEEKQIEAMKINLQATGQNTALMISTRV